MRPHLLVCPGCRTATEDTISVFTLERDGDFLVCRCGRKYPIVEGVPIVGVDISAQSAQGPQLEHVSIYMDAHWAAGSAFVDKIAALPHVPLAVELGCSAGRIVHELCARSDHVVGLEMNVGTIQLARRMLDGEEVAYERRVVGSHYTPARAHTARVDNVTLVCADALDPPLVPKSYDRVVALNLLDSVPRPRQLLLVIDGLCVPGGEIIVSSPYAWQDGIVEEAERLGGADPAAALRAHLASYEILDEAEIPWTLRRDARTEVSYRVHYLRARKGT
jgi:SAM-dependent methyltransferase